jgi:hypothetical protein
MPEPQGLQHHASPTSGVGYQVGKFGPLAQRLTQKAVNWRLAAAFGYPPVLPAEAGIGLARGHHALAERAAQAGVALAGAAGAGAGGGLQGAWVSRAHAAAWAGVGNTGMPVPSSAMRTWALRAPAPVISCLADIASLLGLGCRGGWVSPELARNLQPWHVKESR